MADLLDRSIFRQYDIRGIVEDNFTPAIIKKIGLAFGTRVVSAGGKNVVPPTITCNILTKQHEEGGGGLLMIMHAILRRMKTYISYFNTRNDNI